MTFWDDSDLQAYSSRRHRPCPILRKKVVRGTMSKSNYSNWN